jgi:hypothetical protein
MKKSFLFVSIFALFLICLFSVTSVSGNMTARTAISNANLPGIPADTTVTVTIVKIELSTNSVTLKDQAGKLYVFVVDPSVIDLRRFKVGQSVTATISTTILTNRLTRARITKTQLIKLQ